MNDSQDLMERALEMARKSNDFFLEELRKRDDAFVKTIAEILGFTDVLIKESEKYRNQKSSDPSVNFANELLFVKLLEISRRVVEISRHSNDRWTELLKNGLKEVRDA